MCGIAGIIHFDARPIPPGLLERMTASLERRGPDARNYFTAPGVGLGHQRLSIIDLAGGAQPMSTPDGRYTLVFNGEIYNFRALRTQLQTQGCSFRTDSDAEVLLQAYAAAGAGCLESLNGMFAFAIWDAWERTVFLARDRLGQKPLYYLYSEGSLLFASEARALLQHPLCPRRVSPPHLLQYLALEYVPAPGSLLAGVHKLPASHCLTSDGGPPRVRAYWDLPPPSQPRASEETLAENLRAVLQRAVQRHRVADVPLGFFISGGLDSSAVAALAAPDQGPLLTFGIGFAEPSFDETAYIDQLVRHLGSQHTHLRLAAADLLAWVPSIPQLLDEPMADPSLLPTAALARLAAGQVRVALGGDGGDELFGGYPTYLAHQLVPWLGQAPPVLFPALLALLAPIPASEKNLSWEFKLRRLLQGLAYANPVRHLVWMGAAPAGRAARLLQPDYLPSLGGVYRQAQAHFASRAGQAELERILYLDLRTYLAEEILTKLDRASMFSSLEARSPFLDNEVVNFAASLPASFKLRGRQTKYLLRRALAPLLPPALLQRPKKGFGIPVTRWLKHELRPLTSEILAALPDCFRQAEVQRLYREHLNGRQDHRKQLWALLVLGLWLEHYQVSL